MGWAAGGGRRSVLVRTAAVGPEMKRIEREGRGEARGRGGEGATRGGNERLGCRGAGTWCGSAYAHIGLISLGKIKAAVEGAPQ